MKHFNEETRPPKKRKLEDLQNSPLPELPPEMWGYIFTFLPLTKEQLQALNLVDHRFHDLVMEHLPNQEYQPDYAMDDNADDNLPYHQEGFDYEIDIHGLKYDLQDEAVAIPAKSKKSNEFGPWFNYIPKPLFELLGGREKKSQVDPLLQPYFPADTIQVQSILWGALSKRKWLDENGSEVEFETLAAISEKDLDNLEEGQTRSGRHFRRKKE